MEQPIRIQVLRLRGELNLEDMLKIKTGLVIAISKPVRRLGLTQQAASNCMGPTQPKVSDMMGGDFSNLYERKRMDCLNRLSYDIEIKKTDRTKLPMADKRANYFMKIGTDGDTPSGILNSIENMKRVLYPQFKDNIMLVDYGILMQDTKWTIDAIYDFLKIEHYESDLNNLSTPHTYNDTWGVKNHHTVKSSIEQEKYDLEKIFLPETIEKYSGLEFWRE